MRKQERITASAKVQTSALVGWIACAVLLVVLGSGCTRQHCPGCTDPNPLPISMGGSGVGCPYAESQLTPGSIDKPTLLVLSGGASYGAWGAGVIAGWPSTQGQGASPPRPEFTVVTGISTGALQATYAFLGSQYDDELELFYTTSENDDIYEWDLLGSNALQSREPLRQILQDNVKEDAVLEVADEGGRELYVGTVNLDTSQFCPWNLSAIARKAKSAPAGSQTRTCYVDLFRDAIFAASGAPVLAAPVEIDAKACTGELPQKMLYVDGGVRLRVFVTDVIDHAIQPGSTATAYVIMNGKIVTHPECVEDSLAPIAIRTFEIMDHESSFGSLYTLMHERPQWNLQISRIPDSCCLEFASSEFDQARMKILFEDGKQWVQQTPSPWETTIPTSSAAAWPTNCNRPMGKCPGQPLYPPNTTGCL